MFFSLIVVHSFNLGGLEGEVDLLENLAFRDPWLCFIRWCRLELVTCALATHNVRVIACDGGEATPRKYAKFFFLL